MLSGGEELVERELAIDQDDAALDLGTERELLGQRRLRLGRRRRHVALLVHNLDVFEVILD